jgi:hypothetical protein
MKPKIRGWKEGTLTRTIENLGRTKHLKGSTVRYKKHKAWDTERRRWSGKYEYHYVDQDNYNLIRCSELLIEEENDEKI